MTGQALDKGYQWVREGEEPARLSKRVVGRLAITNYDPASLSNEERRRLQIEADRYPRNYVLVDIRPSYLGRKYPWRGRSNSAVST